MSKFQKSVTFEILHIILNFFTKPIDLVGNTLYKYTIT